MSLRAAVALGADLDGLLADRCVEGQADHRVPAVGTLPEEHRAPVETHLGARVSGRCDVDFGDPAGDGFGAQIGLGRGAQEGGAQGGGGDRGNESLVLRDYVTHGSRK